MNSNRQVEVHYINTGFPYTVTESFMDLFEGLTYSQADTALVGTLPDQGNPYWPMGHANSYKFGYSGSAGSSYYCYSNAYEISDHAPRLDARGISSETYAEELPSLDELGSSSRSDGILSTEECIRTHYNTASQQIFWQDNVDPDNMTYEELLDLGEAVGSQSRGLSKELISSLPVTKYKCSIFSRKKRPCERCVICQMEYKRGDRRMTLPCKHAYHAACVSRWLGINKACPICFAEVFADNREH